MAAQSFPQEIKKIETYFSAENKTAKVRAPIAAVSYTHLLLLFFMFLENPVSEVPRFIAIVLLGGTSISLVFTLMSAIAARAQQNTALIAILGFPVILPILLLLMQLSKMAFGEAFRQGAILQIFGLIALLDILVIAMSVILFPFLWKD